MDTARLAPCSAPGGCRLDDGDGCCPDLLRPGKDPGGGGGAWPWGLATGSGVAKDAIPGGIGLSPVGGLISRLRCSGLLGVASSPAASRRPSP